MQVNDLLHTVALPHIPEGSTAQAVKDQWIHAIATGSSVFCNSTINTPEKLKTEALKILNDNIMFQTGQSGFLIRFLQT